MRPPRLVLVLMVSLLAATLGCDGLPEVEMPEMPEMPEIPGGGGDKDDEKKSKADEIAIDTTLYDRVSDPQGDVVDWKVFELEAARKVTIKIWWDDPADIEANLVLRGLAGGPARSLKHRKGTHHETLGPVDLAAGKWYLQINATDGASVYTLEVVTGDASGGGGGGGDW